MVDDGDPDGLKVYNLCRVRTIRIAAISVMITPVNYFIPLVFPYLCFSSSKLRSGLRPLR
jgi:hypothetical protein